MSDPKSRTQELLIAARQSPEFGLRLLAELPPHARAEALRRWTLPTALSPSDVPTEDGGEVRPHGRPGLRKCGPAQPNNGLSAQLNAFARSVSRMR